MQRLAGQLTGQRRKASERARTEAAREQMPVVEPIERIERFTEAEIKAFRQALMGWYRRHARELPWRGVNDPYRIWLSEIMLQQTRVAAVIEHYHAFLRRFPALVSLALASEDEVLAAWSGLGYYRRARMLHKAAQFITGELGGVFPKTAVELRTLPGIGVYTSAAIASIAFGESVAVVDGNVERVLLRVAGHSEELTAAGRAFVQRMASSLVPPKRMGTAPKRRVKISANTDSGADEAERESEEQEVALPTHHGRVVLVNAAGDHNQAMMELGATVCLPKSPACGACPLYVLCRTRGEHATAARGKLYSREVAYLLALRKRGVVTEVLLARRPDAASLMAGMYELPPLALDATSSQLEGREPVLRLRHAITNTNYYVRVYAPGSPNDRALRRAVGVPKDELHWVKTARLGELPLTGLARKTLQRLDVMSVRPVRLPEDEAAEISVRRRARRRLSELPSEDDPAFVDVGSAAEAASDDDL